MSILDISLLTGFVVDENDLKAVYITFLLFTFAFDKMKLRTSGAFNCYVHIVLVPTNCIFFPLQKSVETQTLWTPTVQTVVVANSFCY